MTKEQLTQSLTSGDDTQIQQAITHFEQQKHVPQELLTACLVAWQLIESSDLRAKFTKLLKKNLATDWHLLLKDKYLLTAYNATAKSKKSLTKVLDSLLMTVGTTIYKDWITYLYPYFPDLLWQDFFNVNQIDFDLLDLSEEATFITYVQKLEKNTLAKLNNAQIEKYLPQLKRLNLKNCKLKTLPNVLKEFPTLEELYLGDLYENNNDFSKGDFTLLTSLKNLKVLDLTSCKLTQLPVVLGQLVSLQELVLNNNDFSKADFAVLALLKNLEVLDVRYCSLTQIPSFLEQLTTLKRLGLSQNSIATGSFKFLDHNPHLEKFFIWRHEVYKSGNTTLAEQFKANKIINLKDCQLTQIPAVLAALVNVEEIDLSGNPITNVDLNIVANLPELKKLFIWKNEFNKNETSIIEQFQKSKSLNFSLCNFTQIPAFLKEFPALEELNLSNNDFSQADLSLLTSFKNLKKLNLSSCKIKQLPVKLDQLTNLEYLNIGRNPLEKGECSFLEKLPNLKTFEIWRADFIKKDSINITEQFKQVKELDLSYLELTQLPEVLSTLTYLEDLCLGDPYESNNNLSKTDFSILASLKNLKILNLENCKITQLPAVLSELTALEELSLNHNKLSDKADFTVFLKLKNLKSLSFYGSFSDAQFQIIEELEKNGISVAY